MLQADEALQSGDEESKREHARDDDSRDSSSLDEDSRNYSDDHSSASGSSSALSSETRHETRHDAVLWQHFRAMGNNMRDGGYGNDYKLSVSIDLGTDTLISEPNKKNGLYSRRRTSQSNELHSKRTFNSHVHVHQHESDRETSHKGKKFKLRRPRIRQGWNCIDRLALRLDRNCPLLFLHRMCHALFWLCFLCYISLVVMQQYMVQPPIPSRRVPIRSRKHLHEKLKSELKGEEQGIFNYWRDVSGGIWGAASKKKNRSMVLPVVSRKRKEFDTPGCVRDEWQSFHFPTCNDIHEIDIQGVFILSEQQHHLEQNGRKTHHRAHRHRRLHFPPLNGTQDHQQGSYTFTSSTVNSSSIFQSTRNQDARTEFNSSTWSRNSSDSLTTTPTFPQSQRLGYLGRGLWRSVWAVNPRLAEEIVVLKSMKREHDIDRRNLERHRRDALVMERLTSFPNVVDVYGYCGTSMLSEFIPTTLKDTLESKNKDGREQMHGPSTNRSEANVTSFYSSKLPKSKQDGRANLTRETPEGRLNLSLQVVKGLYDIHHGLPTSSVVHADLTFEQFLVTDKGQVKINDFNRCRFMAHRVNTTELCSFVIPTSPGRARSPEEYAEQKLTQQIDVYSMANVLYTILTGEQPWRGLTLSETKRMVKEGGHPRIPSIFRLPNSIDAALSELIERAYDVNPSKRLSAKTLLNELEKLSEQRYHSENTLVNITRTGTG